MALFLLLLGQGGVSHMGGKWPARLSISCLEIMAVFEDAELQLYRWADCVAVVRGEQSLDYNTDVVLLL